MKLVAMITEPRRIARFLTALGEPTDVPDRSPDPADAVLEEHRPAPQGAGRRRIAYRNNAAGKRTACQGDVRLGPFHAPLCALGAAPERPRTVPDETLRRSRSCHIGSPRHTSSHSAPASFTYAPGRIPEIVTDDKEGLLVACESPGELAAALTRLVTDEPLRLEMGRAARRSYEARYLNRVMAETDHRAPPRDARAPRSNMSSRTP
ncbi:hypothetical protein [Sorangium sp. So ce363]|uniref:hypothetical protein n=1 Tax=Sorangium sp. So ce363 TaxID=3133304 RepID=UPI003F6220EB